MLCIPKDVNVEKMETSVNLLGQGLGARREAAIAEGCLQPGQKGLHATGGNHWQGQPRRVFMRARDGLSLKITIDCEIRV